MTAPVVLMGPVVCPRCGSEADHDRLSCTALHCWTGASCLGCVRCAKFDRIEPGLISISAMPCNVIPVRYVPPPSRADLGLRDRDATAHCLVCERLTSRGKPFCVLHVERNLYASQVLIRIKARRVDA